MSQTRRSFLMRGTAVGSGLILGGCSALSGGKSDTRCLDIIHQRRSVRKYQSTPVPDEHLHQILDAARMAPTSGNQQPWKFLVVKDPERIQEMKQACIDGSLQRFEQSNPSDDERAQRKQRVEGYYTEIFSATVYVVVLTDNASKYASYNWHDGPLAAGTLILAARMLGYGTCYFTDSIPEEVTREVLHIPDQYKRVCITPIGIPVEWPETPEKKDLSELLEYDSME